ncbi:hypothetical protein JL720_14388 [Aureococcus anophagefferens]|nr:hypothetical protein JL720_14388 [Aureococcus anophagefferens]
MEDVENTSPKSAKSGDGAPKREKGWSAINKVNKELKEKKRENEKLQARVVEISGAMDGLRQQLWELELLEAELKTLRETKDATKKRLSVLDAQTQQARLAAEESRVALLRGTLARYLAAPSDDLARTLAALLDVDAPRGDRAACGPALPAALARRLAAAARATFGRREARTAL